MAPDLNHSTRRIRFSLNFDFRKDEMNVLASSLSRQDEEEPKAFWHANDPSQWNGKEVAPSHFIAHSYGF